MTPELPEPTCEDVALASFIVGCLTYEGYAPLHLRSSDSKQDHLNAIQLIASILSRTRRTNGEHGELPFKW